MKNYYFTCVLLLFFINSYSQTIVINEIITDPQTDWSTNDFNGTDGGGNISNIDEVIELFIKTDGLDLTDWSIELNDTTPVSGDLTNTGAFDVSNYISTNGGTFTNTKNGDFLVLGNVNSSGAINNSVTIVLKNASNIIIDTVTLGSDDTNAPNGNATSTSNESVQRIPNGNDTDIDNNDFVKGTASLGSINTNDTLSNDSFEELTETIYPNPVTNGKLYFKNSHSKNKEIDIYNMIGEKVWSEKTILNQEIDLRNLNTGVYILKIKDQEKLSTQKIIIK